MGTIKIINNFLEENLIDFLYIHFQKIPHYWGHYSFNKDGIKFYSSELNINEPLYNFLCYKISKLFLYRLNILRMYINIQHASMDGDFHIDHDGDTTVLLMITPTLTNNSGCFQIKENNEKINTINFVKNKLIIFPAKWEHKGCAPIEKNIPRITLAFKTEKYE